MREQPNPEDDGPETANDLLTNHSKALKTFLREMTSVYAEDNEMVPVQFGDRAAADSQGGFVSIDPTLPDRVEPDVEGPQILRVLDDTISHEVAHLNWSELESKADFVEEYDGWGYVPGSIINILEDAYIDHKRKEQWYGLRSKMAYSTWLVMQSDEIQPPVDRTMEDDGEPDVKAFIDALTQLSYAGYVKYEDRIPPSVAEFLVDVEPLLKRVRTQDDPAERTNLAHAAMTILQRHADVPDAHGDDVIPEGVKESDVPMAPGAAGGSGGADGGDGSHGEPDPDAGPSDPATQEAVDEIVDALDEADDENAEVNRDAEEITMKTKGVTRDQHDPEVIETISKYTDGYEPTELKVVTDDDD